MPVHADGQGLVEGTVADLSIVGHANLDKVRETGCADAHASERGLGLQERHAYATYAVPRCGMDQLRAPAAPDAEEPFTRGEPEFPADQLVLLSLGRLERVRGAREVNARVGHARSEDQAVEVIAIS